MKVAVIGGGLAGCTCAYFLTRAGVDVSVYEAGPELASGASGNAIGLYNPRFTAEMIAGARFHIQGFKLALQVFADMGDVGWDPCGALHLVTDEQKAVRYPKTVVSWGGEIDMRMVNAAEASAIAGVELTHGALYLPRSGSVSPYKICHEFSAGSEVFLNSKINDLNVLDADAVILAGGMGVLNFPEGAGLKLKSVRGQITIVKENDASKNLKCNLSYGGYITRARDGVHALGASFQRGADHTDILPEDDMDNIQRLAQVGPLLAAGLEVTGHRAGVRAATPDHLPYVGRLSERVYISAGHGSHGILGSLAGAEILTRMILKKDQAQGDDVLKALAPGRF